LTEKCSEVYDIATSLRLHTTFAEVCNLSVTQSHAGRWHINCTSYIRGFVHGRRRGDPTLRYTEEKFGRFSPCVQNAQICIKYCAKNIRAEFRPLGEFTALLRSLTWNKGEGREWKGVKRTRKGGRERKREERKGEGGRYPPPFAFSGYAHGFVHCMLHIRLRNNILR